MPDELSSFQSELTPANLPIWRELFGGIDYWSLHFSPVYCGFGVSRGDGSGVVLIPGFLATDSYLLELNLWLKRIGYQPYMSGIGQNADCLDILVTKLQKTVEKAYRETKRPVHLIGHSLGGILARSAAEENPARVASVITLGSPFRGISSHRIVLEASASLRKRLEAEGKRINKPPMRPGCLTGKCNCQAVAALKRSLVYTKVMQTAIYSESDGIVDWRKCVNEDPATNFKVVSTHIGMAFNPCVYTTIAKRLAQAIARDIGEEIKV